MKINIRNKLKKVIRRERVTSLLRIGVPQPPAPQNFFKKEMTSLLKLNPNNIGTTTRMNFGIDSCRELENKAIKKLLKWFHGGNIDGYINSGSTEGNIMALWIGREHLSKYGKPLIVSHSESHYSIDKGARILNLELLKTKKEHWRIPMDKEQLRKITKNKKSPLIIVATIGHTSTGIIDDIKSITEFIKEYDYPCYLHLDAAVGGFFVPFFNEHMNWDFANPEVQSITFDYHKYGFLHYSSGVFLCRKGLQDYIGNETEYVKIFDDTITGSRSGILPAIIWANTEYLDKSGFKKRAEKILLNKERFIKKLKKKSIPFIDNGKMPMVCVILKNRLSKDQESEFRIHSVKRENGYSYTIYFYLRYLRAYDKLLKLI